MVEETAPTHAAPRITELTFANGLTEGPRVFNEFSEIGAIWRTLTDAGVDPSFALGHFWVESGFGTLGWNIWSDPPLRSWGNILYVNSQVRDRPGVGEYKASNGYEYTYYPDWTTSVVDYCLNLDRYRDRSPDPRYGDTSTIYGACAKWAANEPGSVDHLKYIDIVLGRVARYDERPDWEGEMAVIGASSPTSNQRYLIKDGERWYIKPGGTQSYEVRADVKAMYFGQVAGTSWGMVRINTARFSSDGKSRPTLVYVPNWSAARISPA